MTDEASSGAASCARQPGLWHLLDIDAANPQLLERIWGQSIQSCSESLQIS
jgi:hypothetical protein